MNEDPIVAEVRAVREKLFKECDYSLDKLVAYLHRQRKRLGLKVVRLPPQRVAIDAGGYTKDRENWIDKVDLSDLKPIPAPPHKTRKRKVVSE